MRFQYRTGSGRWRTDIGTSKRFRKGNFTYAQLPDVRTSGRVSTIGSVQSLQTWRLQVIVRLYRNRRGRPDLLQWRYTVNSRPFICSQESSGGSGGGIPIEEQPVYS